jgi:ankyrin repeat protein
LKSSLLDLLRRDPTAGDTLLARMEPTERQRTLDEALYAFVEGGRADLPTASWLLLRGADPNCRTDGGALLCRAVFWSDAGTLALLALLEGHGLDYARFPQALHACVAGRVLQGAHILGEDEDVQQVFEHLLRSGLPPDHRDESGATPLHRAVEHYAAKARFCQAGDLVPLLLRYGASVEAQDAAGRTPIDIARGNGDSETVALLETARLGP